MKKNNKKTKKQNKKTKKKDNKSKENNNILIIEDIEEDFQNNIGENINQIEEESKDEEIKQIEKEIIIINNDDSYSLEKEDYKNNIEPNISKLNSMTESSDSLSEADNNSSLNNKNNPFIKASKKFNNQKYKTLLKEKEKDKEKNEKDNDSENKPPKYFNISKAKLLKKRKY